MRTPPTFRCNHLLTPPDSRQLGGCEAPSPFFLPRMDPRSTSTNALFDPMKPLLPFHDPLERFIYAIGMARGLTDASQAPEIQTMYNLPMPVSTIRTRIRQEFERHRYVNKLPVTDVLLFKSHAEYQV